MEKSGFTVPSRQRPSFTGRLLLFFRPNRRSLLSGRSLDRQQPRKTSSLLLVVSRRPPEGRIVPLRTRYQAGTVLWTLRRQLDSLLPKQAVCVCGYRHGHRPSAPCSHMCLDISSQPKKGYNTRRGEKILCTLAACPVRAYFPRLLQPSTCQPASSEDWPHSSTRWSRASSKVPSHRGNETGSPTRSVENTVSSSSSGRGANAGQVCMYRSVRFLTAMAHWPPQLQHSVHVWMSCRVQAADSILQVNHGQHSSLPQLP